MKRTCWIVILAVVVGVGASVVQAQALFGEWLLNDGSGTTAVDSSGFGLDAAVVGTPSWGSGYFSCDGSN